MTNPRDPNNPIWDGAKFDMLDASFCVLVSKDYDVLIYCVGDDKWPPVFLPAHNMRKIIYMAMDQFKEKSS